MKLNSYLLETLKEFGNIGGGNAAASLSRLMDTQVHMTKSVVEQLHQQDLNNAALYNEEHMISILLPFDGDIEGMVLFLLNKNFARTYLETIMQQDIDFAKLQILELDMLEETASIMASAFIQGIASYLAYTVRIQQPSITMDMKGSILNEVLSIVVQYPQPALCIRRNFWITSCQDANELIFLVKGNYTDKLYASLEVKP